MLIKWRLTIPRKITFRNIAYLTLISIFFLPQYFGFSIGGFAFTAMRIMLMGCLLFIYMDRTKSKQFLAMIRSCKFNVYLIIYCIIIFYTAIYTKSIGTFFSTILDNIMVFYIVSYILGYVIDIKEFLKFIKNLAIIIGVLGVLEFIVRRNPYRILHTINYIPGGGSWRGSLYRIGAMCSHPIGYGMYLLLLIPIICINYDKNRIDFFKNKYILILLIMNMFLTGSRAPIGIMFLELFILFLIGDRKNKRNTLIMLSVILILGSISVILFYKTSIIQYILLQFAQVIDYLFGTNYALQFLGSHSTSDSDAYREVLPQIFTNSKILSPWIGLGTGSGYQEYFSHNGRTYLVTSIDNYYVNQYIMYAYPGLVAIILIFIRSLKNCFILVVKSKWQVYDCIGKTLLVALICYIISLWFADTLGTFKPLFAIFAFIQVVVNNSRNKRGNVLDKEMERV